MTTEPRPTITDADKNCARLILEYVASVTDPRSMIERQLQIFRDEAVSAAIEAEREVWRQMWRYQLRLIRAALIDEPDITPPPVAANANQGE